MATRVGILLMHPDLKYDKLFDLHDRVAVVTGGASGLGKAMACGLATCGANIVIADINVGAAEQTAAEVRKLGRKCLVVETDVSRSKDIEQLTQKALAEFGKIDVLINSAGISKMEGPAADVSEKDWDETLAINLKGTFLCCQRVGRVMIRQGRGKIINITSVDADAALPQLASYCASKGGVTSLTRALALEWASYNITVNAIAPSEFDTPMLAKFAKSQEWQSTAPKRTPITRARGFIGQPSEIVGAAIFLASDASTMVTGHVLSVDGGLLAT